MVREGVGLWSIDCVVVPEGVEGIASASAVGARSGRKRSACEYIVEGSSRTSRPQELALATFCGVRRTTNVADTVFLVGEGRKD